MEGFKHTLTYTGQMLPNIIQLSKPWGLLKLCCVWSWRPKLTRMTKNEQGWWTEQSECSLIPLQTETNPL